MGNSNAAEDYLHYLHGVNPFGMVYLSNMGIYGASKSVTKFYHGWFNDDNPAPGYVTGGANSRYTWADCCKQYDADNSAKGCGSASNNALCYAVSIPTSEPPEKMYSNINNGWPIDSWELTEPSLGYQTYYIRLISNFVQEKGVDIGEKIPSAIRKPVTTAKITPTIEASVSHNAILVTTSRESTVHVCIFDMHGNKVVSLQEKFTGNKRFSLEGLPQGYYIARITNEKAARNIPVAIR